MQGNASQWELPFAQLPVQTQRKHRREKWNDFHFLSLSFALEYYTCELGQRKRQFKRRLKFLSFSFRLLMHLKKLERWDNRAEISPKTFCRN